MAKFTVNNTELEFDIFELSNAELFENEVKKCIKTAETAKGNESISAVIKIQCKAVFDFIDALFGEGKHKEIFGESTNLRECITAFQTICNGINSDKAEFISPAPNRKQRRAAAKK